MQTICNKFTLKTTPTLPVTNTKLNITEYFMHITAEK